MGIISDIWHAKRAHDLETENRPEEAVEHVFRQSGELWEKKLSAARIYKRATLYDNAIRYFKEGLSEKPYAADWYDYKPLVECYEATKEFAAAMELYFQQRGRLGHFDFILEQYRNYRNQDSSFRLSDSRLKELYAGLCKYPPFSQFHYLPADARNFVIRDMEEAGLLDELIQALEESTLEFGSSFAPKQEHFKVAELHKKKGNYAAAAAVYETFNLLDHVPDCYQKSGQIDKLCLYYLAIAKIAEASSIYENAGDRANAERIKRLSTFNLEVFIHPSFG